MNTNNKKNFYAMSDVSCAKVTLELHGQTDKFGDQFVNIFQVIWAAKVILWFRNYLNKVREFIRSFRTTWNGAVSKVWRLIKVKILNIPDTPL